MNPTRVFRKAIIPYYGEVNKVYRRSKMKKFFVFVVTLLMLASMLVGCGEAATKGDKIDVGIVLPTKDESRWLADEAKFIELIKENGYKAEIMYSQANSATEKTNVESLISKGMKVLIICPFDVAAAGSTVEKAKAEGIHIISYDRLIIDSEAVDYYITFDSIKIGESMGKYLVDHAVKSGKTGLNLYLYSGALTDNNSFDYFQGYWNALQPYIANGTFIVRNSAAAMKHKDTLDLSREQLYEIMQSVDTEWDMEVSKTLAEAHLTSASPEEKDMCYIIAPDDDTCRAISDTFAADSYVKDFRICGADGVEASVQYIIDGKQDMTVYCNPEIITTNAMNLAYDLINGKTPKDTTMTDNGKIDVRTITSDVQTVTRDNIVKMFFDSGRFKGADYKNWERISDAVKPNIR
jgi:putative multiple sugar transport system substrate-binding protein